MKSIRHSLIFYFLLLLSGSLGAISWISYRTTAEALFQGQLGSRKVIEGQCEDSCKAVRDDLDRRILEKSHAMANMRLVTEQFETIYPASLVGAAAARTAPFLSIPLWLPQGPNFFNRKVDPYPFWVWAYPKHTHIESADSLLAATSQNSPQEYFQLYRTSGNPFQRSPSMGNSVFTLDKDLQQAALFSDYFDNVELKPGLMVRRITLKTPVSRQPGGVANVWPGRRAPQPGGKYASTEGPKPPPPFPPRPTYEIVYIQYASDLAPVEDKILELRQQRDSQLAHLDATVTEDLKQMRGRMIWIGLTALVALCAGAYLLIRHGLEPLSKMSEAVSRVSPSNFQLALDTKKLPQELQPIAARLSNVLTELQKAFAREKQAAADISHELRTPLAALMTTLEVGLRKTRSVEEYREILDECRGSGQHMYQLVERLLTLARLDAGADQYRPLEVDATEIALQCADLIRPLAKARGLELRLNLSEPIALRTDPNKLREVIVNLLHNAVEYNRPRGSIELALETVARRLRIEVRDSGIGIKPEALQRIFERFYRADPSRHADSPHAGLGLAIVKSYVDLMGGTIGVTSSDAGSVFTVELPLNAGTPRSEHGIRGASPVLVQP